MDINDNFMRPKRPCPIVFQSLGATGPTARCNKSSIYIFKW